MNYSLPRHRRFIHDDENRKIITLIKENRYDERSHQFSGEKKLPSHAIRVKSSELSPS